MGIFFIDFSNTPGVGLDNGPNTPAVGLDNGPQLHNQMEFEPWIIKGAAVAYAQEEGEVAASDSSFVWNR
jgi:hypothetical protein